MNAQRPRAFRFAAAILLVLSLAACGGGGGGGGGTSSSAPTTYRVGGSVSGLSGGGTLVLQDNGGDNLTLTANGSFSFGTKLAGGATYAVSVLTQPAGEVCTVSSGSGNATADVTGVSVQCIVPWTGTKQFGAAGHGTIGTALATDAAGNIYVAGFTEAGLDGNTLTGTQDFYLRKYDRSGVKQYTVQLGAAGAMTHAGGVAVDAGGNVYVAGWTAGGLDGNALTGTIDVFLTKYDSSGAKQFTRQLGVANAVTYGGAVAVDAGGNVYVTGWTAGSLDPATAAGALSGMQDAFIAKYNSSGAVQSIRQIGVANANTQSAAVATDAAGNVYVAGFTHGALGSATLAGNTDFFLIKYDAAGTRQYTAQLGTANAWTYASGVATDANGNVYVAGETTGGLDGNTLTGTTDAFLTKYDSSGAKQYTRQLGAAGVFAPAHAVATDAGGNVDVMGDVQGGGLDGNTLTGTSDFFLTRFNSSGVKQYTRELGASGADTGGWALATDANGNAFVTGNTNGNLDGNTLSGIWDAFVTKYDSNGVKQ